MKMKEKMLEAVKELPADATIEDAMERFLFLAKVERGIQQADAGQTISQYSMALGCYIHQELDEAGNNLEHQQDHTLVLFRNT